MKQQFNSIIHQLDTDKYFGITVFDLTHGKPIINSKSKEDIINLYGSIENFFNGLFAGTTTKIGIRTRRKNGMNRGKINWKDGKEPMLEFTATPVEKPLSSPEQPIQGIPMAQNLGNSNSFGLSPSEIISLHVSQNDKIRLETENKYLKDKVEKLEKENFDYRERELEAKYSSNKSDKTHELVQAIIANAHNLKQVFSPSTAVAAVETTAEATGLGNPNNSEFKNELLHAIQVSDETTAEFIGSVYMGLNNQEFFTELTELIKKYNL